MRRCQQVILIVLMVLLAGPAAAAGVRVSESERGLEVSNELVHVKLDDRAGGLELVFSARDGTGGWRRVASQFRPDFEVHPSGNAFFDTSVTPFRYAVAEAVSTWTVTQQTDEVAVIRLSGRDDDGTTIVQTITLKDGDDFLHFDISATLAAPSLDYVLNSFVFEGPERPEFVHTPTAKMDDPRSGPARDQVIGDHAFHAPAVILQHGRLFTALVPDVNSINEHPVTSKEARRTQRVARNQFSVPIIDQLYTMPTALDLNVRSGLVNKALFSYGMLDFVVGHHVRYQRANDASMIRELNQKQVKYAFDLFVSADASQNLGFQKIVRHQWRQYGHKTFMERHLAMPFEAYFRTVYDVVSAPMLPSIQPPTPGFADHGVFLDFEINGEPVGGMVSPLPFYGRGVLWNFEFWNNLRDASGMHYWGTKTNNAELVVRASRIINLALSAPQNDSGFFPLIYSAVAKKWITSSLGPSSHIQSIFANTDQVYNVPAMSKSAAHMIEYYRNCEADERILGYLKKYADGLLPHINGEGTLPSYFDKQMQPLSALTESAQPAATMWFLAELYNITEEEKYLDGAERIARYLIRNVLPQQRWIDLEPYYSCGRNPLTLLADDEQTLPVRGNLAAFWATRGFAALYRASAQEEYLQAGEQTIDYVSFSQACWDPHYVYTAFPFGGFTVDNIDTATWMDARQCEMVQPFIWYGKTLGRQDLLERGVAAARSSTVLVNHPRHKSNGIYEHTNLYGLGLGPENINHEGHNQSAMRTHPAWGECSGIFNGLSDAARELGGCYVDFDKGVGVGCDGLLLTKFELRGRQIQLHITNKLARLNQPWEKGFDTLLKVHGLREDGVYSVRINDEPILELTTARLLNVPLRVHPDGRVSIAATAALSAQPITFESLLNEQVDRDALARYPVPSYQQLQASSYNRLSTVRDQPEQGTDGWFADSDGISWIREEVIDGKTEWVIMEHDGPGCLTKFWTPFFYYGFGNRVGPKIRIYLDGSADPVIDETFIELLTRNEWPESYGDVPAKRNSFETPSPFADFTARAGDLYLPIPFARSCKVTLTEKAFYNIINYRAYPAGTSVKTFTKAQHRAAALLLSDVADELLNPEVFTGGTKYQTKGQLKPGDSDVLELSPGNGAIRHLEVQFDPRQVRDHPEVLRSLVLKIRFDGEETVWCPVGDFFCSANAINPMRTFTRTVSAEGQMVCQWVMPYRAEAQVSLENLGAHDVSATLVVRTGPWDWDERSMHFSARWRSDETLPGDRFVDWNFIDIHGKGVFVGDAWTVLNRTRGWWGEGDEKIYIDDAYDVQKFPTHFGTGTEDYYGWAGGVNPTKEDIFSHPFLANASVGSTDENNTRGFNVCTRLRSLDAIPFSQRLVFDMEASPGTGQRNRWDLLCYSAVSYFYARPGARTNRPPLPEVAAKPIVSLEDLDRKSDAVRNVVTKRVPGAIECERLKVVAQSPNVTAVAQIPASSFRPVETLSDGRHLFVPFKAPGDYVEVKLTEQFTPKQITLHVSKCYDFGVARILVNGKVVVDRVDLHAPNLEVQPLELGVIRPVNNAVVIRLELLAENPRSRGARTFAGLDCIELTEPE